MTEDAIRKTNALHLRRDGAERTTRALAREVPVAIVCNGTTQAVMMATPEDLTDFAHGFALTEGFIGGLDDVEECEIVAHDSGIEARFWLDEGRADILAARRRRMAGPVGCGLCGIDSLSEATRPLPRIVSDLRLGHGEAEGATEALRAMQPLQDVTRASHAAGFLVPGRGLVLAREDVGRHNALDKLVGALLRSGVDPASGAAVMTSRLSLELVQKAAMSGIPILIAVSAPTAQAVDAAEAAGITLVAGARGTGFDLYAHPERITREPD
ncbi:formate dehydrogenase accessory sulfurtransferase FdhD [Palleronia sp. LCG004]|uniref:formate dehydrogenase accessory sulfurtransferase FdhD n=1 Tax=Palleronia sp. LCG004 TaxID=3079304 RepID=UPI0029431969|nr:formate dehydrogenase accessory sulfurtransferase FdhD [Palleronia sp. LCG004]WOI56756.1 formate dehydrogenase accessory sulfurtransferase FdhD [Palleronia sp. LCG004]